MSAGTMAMVAWKLPEEPGLCLSRGIESILTTGGLEENEVSGLGVGLGD